MYDDSCDQGVVRFAALMVNAYISASRCGYCSCTLGIAAHQAGARNFQSSTCAI